MQRAITHALAVYSFVLIRPSLPRLPERIPMHFNRLGKPDRWDSPDSLWIMLGVQIAFSGLILTVPTGAALSTWIRPGVNGLSFEPSRVEGQSRPIYRIGYGTPYRTYFDLRI